MNYQKEIYAFVFGERYRSIEDPISRHYHFKTEVAAVVFIGLHTFYAILYSLKMPFFEKYKIDPSPWPWELENWSELKWYLIKSLAFNHLVTYPVIQFSQVYFFHEMFVEDDAQLPDHWTIVIHILFCMVVEDFYFYFAHRLLHWKPLYLWIHKIHHKFPHCISFLATSAHPLEVAFCFQAAFLMGPFLLCYVLNRPMHMYTGAIWILARIGESLDGHSGYEFSFSMWRLLPLSAGGYYHGFHHSHNTGNYASFYILWDTFFGTNHEYYKYMQAVEDVQQKLEAKKSS